MFQMKLSACFRESVGLVGDETFSPVFAANRDCCIASVAGGKGGNRLGVKRRRETCALGIVSPVMPEREVAAVETVGTRDAVVVVAVVSVAIETIRALE